MLVPLKGSSGQRIRSHPDSARVERIADGLVILKSRDSLRTSFIKLR